MIEFRPPKMRNRYWPLALLALLALLVLVVVPACGRERREPGVLRWGSDAEGGAPFVFADPERPGEEIGFEVDLAAEIARVLGMRAVRFQAPYENLVQVLDRGDCDFVLNGFEPTDDRMPQVLFTRPYYIFQQQLSVASGTQGIGTLADCGGKRVGCLGHSASHKVLEAAAGVVSVVYEDSVKAYEDVVNGRNTAALADLPIARALAPQFPSLVHVGEPFGEYYYSIAVRRGDRELRDRFDACIGTLLREGTLERIYRKWNLWTPQQERLGDPKVAALLRGDDAGPARLEWGPALSLLATAAGRTVLISVCAMGLAVALGLAIALGRLYGPEPVRWLCLGYVEVFRGTPVLVQLLLLYYGLGQIPALQMTAFAAGILGLGLNYAAYEAEVYRGALSAIPRGQHEAGLALGLSGAAVVRHVILPQAARLVLAPSTNDFIALFKDSSIVMVITVVELTKQYSMLASATGRFITLGLVTAGLYLAMSLPLAWLARSFERRLDRDRA